MIVRYLAGEGGSVVESLVSASSTLTGALLTIFSAYQISISSPEVKASLQFADDLIMMKPNALPSRAT